MDFIVGFGLNLIFSLLVAGMIILLKGRGKGTLLYTDKPGYPVLSSKH